MRVSYDSRVTRALWLSVSVAAASACAPAPKHVTTEVGYAQEQLDRRDLNYRVAVSTCASKVTEAGATADRNRAILYCECAKAGAEHYMKESKLEERFNSKPIEQWTVGELMSLEQATKPAMEAIIRGCAAPFQVDVQKILRLR